MIEKVDMEKVVAESNRRSRWARKHLANVDGRSVKEWRVCDVCRSTTLHYQMDGKWACHRKVWHGMIEAGAATPSPALRSHA